MMGAGKSAVGRSLAATTGRAFIDTDQLLQHKLGRSITQVFSIYGEDAFRDHETCILRELEPSFAVLSTGGGIVMREPNWVEMRRLGTTIFLDAEPDVLISRLSSSKKKRPLLMAEDWEERVRAILAARLDLYRRADLRISVKSESIEVAAEQVLAALKDGAL